MTTCLACGQAVAGVVQWTFRVEHKLLSQNKAPANKGNTRWSYGQKRTAWTLLIKNASRDIPRPTGKRRVVLTRMYSGRESLWDDGNLVGGAKMVIDALVRAGVLIDDASKFAEVVYRQEKGDWSGARFEVGDV